MYADVCVDGLLVVYSSCEAYNLNNFNGNGWQWQSVVLSFILRGISGAWVWNQSVWYRYDMWRMKAAATNHNPRLLLTWRPSHTSTCANHKSLVLLRSCLLSWGSLVSTESREHISWVSWEFWFCIGFLTVGSWLCIFCSLDLRTLGDHCRAGRATLRSMPVSVYF